MGRLRVRRLPTATYTLLLNLTNRHIHAQLVDRQLGRVVIAAHSNEPSLRAAIAGPQAPSGTYATASVAAARFIGTQFAQRARENGVDTVYWIRPGKYHGKIKAFIDAVKEGGVEAKTALSWEMPPSSGKVN